MNKKYIKENIFIVTYGLILFFIIHNLKFVLKTIDNLVAITLPVIFGIVLAFLLNIPMSFLERKIILLIQKLKVDKNFKNELNIIENEVSVSAEYIPKNDKSFKIFCKITENGETVFEIRTLAGSSEHAKRIVDNWKNNATDIYPKIMKALNCEDEENN